MAGFFLFPVSCRWHTTQAFETYLTIAWQLRIKYMFLIWDNVCNTSLCKLCLWILWRGLWIIYFATKVLGILNLQNHRDRPLTGSLRYLFMKRKATQSLVSSWFLLSIWELTVIAFPGFMLNRTIQTDLFQHPSSKSWRAWPGYTSHTLHTSP